MIALSLDSLEVRSLPSTGLLPPLNEFAATAPQLTPTIDRNPGSVVASGLVMDGQGADQIAYPRNRMASATTMQADAAMSLYQPQVPNRQGIIAILIGL
jgi:hypothetical protein